MKIPQRILGLIVVAAPVIVGCGSDASEPTSTKRDPSVQDEAPAPKPASVDPAAVPADLPPASKDPTGSEEDAAPELEPARPEPTDPQIRPGFSSPATGGGEPCPACGMG